MGTLEIDRAIEGNLSNSLISNSNGENGYLEVSLLL